MLVCCEAQVGDGTAAMLPSRWFALKEHLPCEIHKVKALAYFTGVAQGQEYPPNPGNFIRRRRASERSERAVKNFLKFFNLTEILGRS